MSSTDLNTVVQEMMAQMDRMQAELNSLKERANVIVSPEQPARPAVSTTRRTTIKRLGLALMGGLATATALGQAPAVQARIIINPQGNLADKAGMVVLLPGVDAPSGTAYNYKYALIASAETAALVLSTLPPGDTGVFGRGYGYGIFGSGTAVGVGGKGSTGVSGDGSSYGVEGISGNTGVKGQGNNFGVVGSSDQVGVYGVSTSGTGVKGQGYHYGVEGTGNYGVYGTGTDVGVLGVSLAGTGIKAASQTGAPLNISPSFIPQNPNDGDIYIDNNTGQMKFFANLEWRLVTTTAG